MFFKYFLLQGALVWELTANSTNKLGSNDNVMYVFPPATPYMAIELKFVDLFLISHKLNNYFGNILVLC